MRSLSDRAGCKQSRHESGWRIHFFKFTGLLVIYMCVCVCVCVHPCVIVSTVLFSLLLVRTWILLHILTS